MNDPQDTHSLPKEQRTVGERKPVGVFSVEAAHGCASPLMEPPLPIIVTALDEMRTKLFWFLGHWLDPKGQIHLKIPIGRLFHAKRKTASLFILPRRCARVAIKQKAL